MEKKTKSDKKAKEWEYQSHLLATLDYLSQLYPKEVVYLKKIQEKERPYMTVERCYNYIKGLLEKTKLPEGFKIVSLPTMKVLPKTIIEVWTKVVGDEIAKHTKPVKLENNKLFITVESAVWREQLSLKEKDILKNFNKQHKSKIKEIVFI